MTVSWFLLVMLCREIRYIPVLTQSHFLLYPTAAETMVNHPALVLALKDVLLSEQESHRDKGSPKSHASATLMVLERSITPEMSSYENLRDLLEAVTTNPATTNEIDDIDDEIINATAV